MAEQDERAVSKAYSVLTLLYHRGMIRETLPQSTAEDFAGTLRVRELVAEAIVACEREMRRQSTPEPQPDAVTEAAVRAANLQQLLNDHADRGARIDRLTVALLAVVPALERLKDGGRLATIVRGALEDAGDSSRLLAATEVQG